MNRETRERLRKQAAGLATRATTAPPQPPEYAHLESCPIPKPAKKPPAAPPVMAGSIPTDTGPCCACGQGISPHHFVQQTKRGRWRHVTCPARTTKEKRPSVTADQRDGRVEKQGRLPHGTIFHAVYDDELKCWTGGFTIDGKEIAIVRSGLFRLATDCDRLYRQSAWKKKVDTEPAKV